MAVIKRSDASDAANGAVVLNLGDLAAEGRRIRQRAQQDAHQVRLEAEAERRRLIKGAVEEGRRAGHEQGLRAGRDEGREQGRREARAEAAARLQTLDAAWAKALEAMNSAQVDWQSAARASVLNLALEIARRVTHRVVEVDRLAVEGPLTQAIALVAQGTRPVICVNPADEDAVRECLPRLARRLDAAREAELSIEERVTRGSCVVRTAGGAEIDADLETQLERIVSALKPPAGMEKPRPIDGADMESDEADGGEGGGP